MWRWLRSTWAWVGRNHEQLKIVFVLVAALYVVFEYRVKVQEDRVKRAVDHVERYDEYKTSGAIARLNALWLSGKVRILREQMKKEPTATRADVFHARFTELLQTENLTPEVHRTLTYFRKVAVCANAGLCDPDTICRFMFDDIQSFRETYRGLIETEFKHEGRAEVTALAEQDCGQQFGSYCKDVPGSPYCQKR